MVLGLGLIPRFRLAAAEALDLEPSRHWPDPVVAEELADEAGPVLVVVEYTVEPAKRAAFAAAARSLLRPMRRRDGAVFWEVFVDSGKPDRCVECWLVESWRNTCVNMNGPPARTRNAGAVRQLTVVAKAHALHRVSPASESTRESLELAHGQSAPATRPPASVAPNRAE